MDQFPLSSLSFFFCPGGGLLSFPLAFILQKEVILECPYCQLSTGFGMIDFVLCLT